MITLLSPSMAVMAYAREVLWMWASLSFMMLRASWADVMLHLALCSKMTPVALAFQTSLGLRHEFASLDMLALNIEALS